ncbi:MAG: hypothetical protein M3O61_01755 [Gemmatimonadota bacterium]|nr:hypothetical protein [Gemmatimonadota bacterium]
MPRFSRMLPPALWRPAVFLAAFAQILLGVAPITEIRLGDDAGAHIEAAGTQLHHSHTDANCPACVGQHLLTTAEPRAATHYAIVRARPHAARSATDLSGRVAGRASWSRAPPSLF